MWWKLKFSWRENGRFCGWRLDWMRSPLVCRQKSRHEEVRRFIYYPCTILYVHSWSFSGHNNNLLCMLKGWILMTGWENNSHMGNWSGHSQGFGVVRERRDESFLLELLHLGNFFPHGGNADKVDGLLHVEEIPFRVINSVKSILWGDKGAFYRMSARLNGRLAGETHGRKLSWHEV